MKDPKEEAVELVEEFTYEINQSDFHVPEYISGVSNESDGYGAVLDEETKLLAKQCALICVEKILEALGCDRLTESPYTTLEERQHYMRVKIEIEKL